MGNCCEKGPQTQANQEQSLNRVSETEAQKVESKIETETFQKTEFLTDLNKKTDHNLNLDAHPAKTEMIEQSLVQENVKGEPKMNSKNFIVSPDLFVQLKNQNASHFYTTIKDLGQGAYGKVVLVEHKSSGVVRAMKCIKKKKALANKEKELFNEASILKQMDHPNIVKIFELFQDLKYYYMITEYCSGGELFDKIQENNSFSEAQAAEYMRQLLSAVVYCHQQKVMHRDLKPENILFESKHIHSQLKVIDFGVASRFEPGKKKTEKFGTPYYIAPEVIDKNYNEKCDVWSCGVILYILLCGYPPFNGADDRDIMDKVKAGRFKFYEEDWGKISIEAKDLISKMLTYSPMQRISSEEILEHKWFHLQKTESIVSQNILKRLSNFRSQNKMRQAILTFIATQTAAKDDKQELLQTFKALDLDNNGIITINELIMGYHSIYKYSIQDAEQEVKEIMKHIDMNLSNEVDFTEFVVAATDIEKLLSKKKLEQAFKLFDEDGDGFLTKNEMERAMGGIDLGGGVWEDLLQEYDVNGDERIDFHEFVEFCSTKVQNRSIKKKERIRILKNIIY